MTSASSLRALSFWPRSPYCDSLRKQIVMKALSCGIERLGWLFSISRNMVVPDRCEPSRKTGGFAVCSLMERLAPPHHAPAPVRHRSEEHTSELQSLMRISYAVFCLKKKKTYEI